VTDFTQEQYQNIFQTVQCLSDSWRNVIGSAGITVLLAFCDTQDSLQDSDEEHVEFAKYYLEDLRFSYQVSKHDDKKVCDPECSLFICLIITYYFQKWKGLFCSPFVLQTFAAHLTAIEASMRIPDLHNKPTTVAVGGLGLATASVHTVYFACSVVLTVDRSRGL
jgi:hypothetical protein